MISWDNYYKFAAKEVEVIGISDNTSGTHPYVMTVYLKSGNKISISYQNPQKRKTEMLNLSRQIEMECNREGADLRAELFTIKGTVNRMDKRQIRVWKLLKDLLKVKGDEVPEVEIE